MSNNNVCFSFGWEKKCYKKKACIHSLIINFTNVIYSYTYWFFTGAGMRGLLRERIYYGVYRFWFTAKIFLAMSHQVRILPNFV